MAMDGARRNEIRLRLPDWVGALVADWDRAFDCVETRMALVIELARKNVEHKTGGPFAAGVFGCETGWLVAIGVNLVESSNCSMAHAEMVAIALAQQSLGHFDLGADGMAHELVASTEPCAMCLGAIPWSGVRRVVCGARDEDARAIGFDEGPKPTDWVGALRSRGIDVVRDVLRDEARAVLQDYAASGGLIYNSRRDTKG